MCSSPSSLMITVAEPRLLPFFFFNDTATTEIYTLSLHDALPICLVLRAEHQVLHQLAVGSNAFDGQVAAGALLAGQGIASLSHGVQHGQAAGLVEIQADAQADLVGARVLLKGFHQRQDGISGVGRDVAEHRGACGIEGRSEEHTSELQSPCNLVCRLLLEKKKNT